ncbi:MAG: response regulator [Devosia sp.]|uniref:response regulator n=1 Tax=Devosia sp. TaxID=1871048 RepID=UPI00260FFCE3|nr:response regulator [Devosia sp.]MDB5535370.1 response regulator [Devosia sp.]MDB5585338.1 response regulator [Devosia sp.]
MAQESIPNHGVLIADPSANMVSLIGGMLRGVGRRDYREANDAQSAMDELANRQFDVLVIDDGLDGLDGVELVRQLRASVDSPNRYVPVVMISAAPDAKRIAEARDAGVTEFLRKPFAAAHLQSRLVSIDANPRGFVEAETYKGPDRRRKTVDIGDKDRRDEAPLILVPKAS